MHHNASSPVTSQTVVSPGVQKTTRAQQYVLYFASGLVLTMGFFLYLLSEQTERYFAWTIGVPLTAAFLGGGYWASFFLEFLAARETVWAKSRIAVPAVLVFTVLTLIATVVHLDRFHLNAPETVTMLITWAWFLIYALQPFVMGYVYWRQLQVPGRDPVRLHVLPVSLRIVLSVQALFLLAVGIGLFLLPQTFAGLWPWELTPLTARAVGAWLVGVGITAGHAVLENDWTRVRPMMVAYAVYGILQVINLARYPDAAGLDWSAPKLLIYVVVLVTILLVGLYGTWMSQRVRKPLPK